MRKQGDTGGLQEDTEEYMRIQDDTGGYIRIHEDT